MKLISFFNYLKDQYFLPQIYYKKYKFPVFETYKYVNYFREYDKWIGKLDLPEYLKILDIGSDYGSLFYYLKLKGYKIKRYKPYDPLIFRTFVIDYYEFTDDYNFIKIDCEGCEYDVIKDIDYTLFRNKTVAIAFHFKENYD
ncbi:MAG: FkbM family methyltransferase, partial [Caldisphaera sp.]